MGGVGGGEVTCSGYLWLPSQGTSSPGPDPAGGGGKVTWSGPPSPISPFPFTPSRTRTGSPTVNRQTPLKTLPSLVLRTWSVTRTSATYRVFFFFGSRSVYTNVHIVTNFVPCKNVYFSMLLQAWVLCTYLATFYNVLSAEKSSINCLFHSWIHDFIPHITRSPISKI